MWICWMPSRALAAISSISSDKGLTLETSANTLFTAFSISTSTLRWYIVRFTATPTQTKSTVVLTGTSIPLYYSYDWLLLLVQKTFLNNSVKEISLKSLSELPEISWFSMQINTFEMLQKWINWSEQRLFLFLWGLIIILQYMVISLKSLIIHYPE